MASPNHRNIAPSNFELWAGRLTCDHRTVPYVQAAVTEYVAESGITVVGYFNESHRPQPAHSSLTLLRWPDSREGYHTPNISECEVALTALATRLDAHTVEEGIVPHGKIHVMMGRKIDGYGDEGKVAPLDVLERALPDCSVTAAHMVSARVCMIDSEIDDQNAERQIEQYGEPVGIIIADLTDKTAIQTLADQLQQHHYAIEYGRTSGRPGHTEFYETPHAA